MTDKYKVQETKGKKLIVDDSGDKEWEIEIPEAAAAYDKDKKAKGTIDRGFFSDPIELETVDGKTSEIDKKNLEERINNFLKDIRTFKQLPKNHPSFSEYDIQQLEKNRAELKKETNYFPNSYQKEQNSEENSSSLSWTGFKPD